MRFASARASPCNGEKAHRVSFQACVLPRPLLARLYQCSSIGKAAGARFNASNAIHGGGNIIRRMVHNPPLQSNNPNTLANTAIPQVATQHPSPATIAPIRQHTQHPNTSAMAKWPAVMGAGSTEMGERPTLMGERPALMGERPTVTSAMCWPQ